MSRPFTETLHCEVRVSARALAFNRGIHGLAFAVVAALALYRPLLLACVPVIALSFRQAARMIRLSHARSVRHLRWLPHGPWVWQRNDGAEYRGHLRHATVLGRHGVILRLRAERQRVGTTTVVVMADSLPAATHRRLRARLTLWQPPDDTFDLLAGVQDRLARIAAAVRRR